MDEPATVSPLRDLVPGHAAPERLHPETRWASLVPYAAAAGLLADVRYQLPRTRMAPRCVSTHRASPIAPRSNS
jgi:hypothetical protein